MDNLRGLNADESLEMSETDCATLLAQDFVTGLEDFIFDSSLNMIITH